MTKRNLKQELSYHTYIDMENGNDIESIDFHCLIELLSEYHRRIKRLENNVEALLMANQHLLEQIND
jgi:predicted transposase YbfD/YdcC